MTTLRMNSWGGLVPIWAIIAYGPGKRVQVRLNNPRGPIVNVSMLDILLP